MSSLCVVRGCPGSYRTKKRGEKVYYFKALEDQLEEWSRVIPGNDKIKIHDKVCSRHFKDEDLMKEWNFVIDDKTVTMPRGRWTLRVGAVPAIFGNYGDDPRERIERKSKPRSLEDVGSSSSDEERRRKRVKKFKRALSGRFVKNEAKQVPDIPDADLKSKPPSPEQTSREPDEKSVSHAADVAWEEACDSFVDQLSDLCSPTPVRDDDAKPAKRGPGRPRKAEGRRPNKDKPSGPSRAQPGRPCKKQRGGPRKAGRSRRPTAERFREADLVSQTPSSNEHSTQLEQEKSCGSGCAPDSETDNSVIIEEFMATGCDETIDVDILDEPAPSSRTTSKRPAFSSSVTVKEERCDDGYKNSAPNKNTGSYGVTTVSEDLIVRDQQTTQDSGTAHDGVRVKRETCDCERGDSQCCAPQANCYLPVSEPPTFPVPCEGTNAKPRADIEENITCPEPETDRNGRTSRMSEVIVPNPVSQALREVPKSQREMALEKVPRTTDSHLQDGGSDGEMDFSGFSSDEAEELVSKRKHFQNTAEMAAKSAKLYFSKMNEICKTPANKLKNEIEELSSRGGHQNRQKSTTEMALKGLPACSKKPGDDVLKEPVKAAPTSREPSTQDGRNLPKETPAPDFQCDEVLQCGRISNEVTLTKAPKPSQGLEKVTVVPNSIQSLDKVTSCSAGSLLAKNPNPRTYSSKGNLFSHKKGAPPSSLLKDKVTPTSIQGHLLKDKVTISKQGAFKDQGTSTAEYEPLKDKIPTPYTGSASDRFSHLLNGSSLDRIIQSSRSSSLLDSITTACGPTVDKTSLILKNFKTDGVLALECVVLKEQVRQLQKELFLHKQMLIDSEHNASLLQRRLELQAQLPCANCVNIRRGFIGKETFI